MEVGWDWEVHKRDDAVSNLSRLGFRFRLGHFPETTFPFLKNLPCPFEVSLDAPNGLVCEKIYDNSISIKRESVSGATGYEIYVNNMLLQSSVLPSVTLMNLLPDTEYSIKVAAKTLPATGPQSNATTVRTKEFLAGGSGVKNDPYLIKTAEHLQRVSEKLNVYYKLGDDIDLEGAMWTPVESFTGELDGNGKTISNLENFYLGWGVETSGALVVCMDGGIVENCHIKFSDFEQGNCWETPYGGLIGSAENVSISYCSAVNVTGSGGFDGFGYMGGIVGYLADSTISRCWFSGSLISYFSIATGGIVGFGSNITMTECYSNADLEVRWGGECGAMIGGTYDGGLNIQNCFSLCGSDIPPAQPYSSPQNMSPSQSSNQATFFADLKTNAANLNLSPEKIQKIQEFYDEKAQSASNISLMSSVDAYCGMIGWELSYDSVVDCCYSLCHPFKAATITNSFYNTDMMISWQLDGIGKSTNEMMLPQTYPNWDFDSVWAILPEETFPFLQNLPCPFVISLDGAPDGLSNPSTTTSSVTLTWNPVLGATSYEVDLNGTVVLETKYTIATVANLNQGIDYSFTLDRALALTCAKYSAMAYRDMEFEEGIGFRKATGKLPDEPVALHKELELCGYDGVISNFDGRSKYGDDIYHNVSFTLAHKKVSHFGLTRNLVLVVICGIDSVEWKGNMDITGADYDPLAVEHYSFNEARICVENELDSYINSNSIDNPLLLITGHSRGAAVANLLAYELSENNGIGANNVFAYTFATPNNTTQPQQSQNIFNFCFQDDFVTQSPLTGWGYSKHGITYGEEMAEDAYRNNLKFKKEMDGFGVRCYNGRTPDFNKKVTERLTFYLAANWDSMDKYYYKHYYSVSSGIIRKEDSLYTFLRNAVAATANKELPGITKLISSMGDNVFGVIASYFVEGSGIGIGNLRFNNYIYDTHLPTSYYAAMMSDVFTTVSPFTTASENDMVINPVNPNQTEILRLKEFAQHGDNLANLGWTLNDVSTWNGVLWTNFSENRVCSIDLAGKELSGILNLSGFSGLEHVNVAGNFISGINMTGCSSLIDVNCSMNSLESLTVPSAETVNCAFNQLESLDVSGAVNLTELYCGMNGLTALDLSHNTALTKLDASQNNLPELDLSANTSIAVLRCEGNYLDIQEDSSLWIQIQTLKNSAVTLASYELQKMKQNFVLNSDEVDALTQFANQNDNLTKLGWNLSNPETWSGIQWIYANDEYHVREIVFDNLSLTGDLNLSGMRYLTRVFCGNNDLTSIDVSGCDRLFGLSCRNSGIAAIDVSNCAALAVLDCENNYLEVSDIINDVNIIRARENAYVSYENQKLPYDFTVTTPGMTYDETSKALLLDAVQFSAEGAFPASVFIEVTKLTASDSQAYISSGTINLNTSGTGTYSLAAPPVAISTAGDRVRISVYSDDSRVQLIYQLYINHMSLVF